PLALLFSIYFYLSLLSCHFLSLFSFQCSLHHQHLPSFPTRRSSDLSRTRHHLSIRIGIRICADAQFLRRLLAIQNHLARHPRIPDRKSTRLNSSHRTISYAVFCLKKKKKKKIKIIISNKSM